MRLDASGLAALQKFPGETDSEKLRAAVMRGTIIDEWRRTQEALLEAHRKGLAMMIKEAMKDTAEAVADMEREIMSALRDLPTPDEKVAKKIAGSLSRVIAHGIMPQVDMGRKEPLRKEIAALAHASGELDE
ncbi:hypothetical protein [Acidihalobacter prosperus]|uniref:hypothetical protein n=1 Tax=Acidihalobacter prosperus TaxID=160660 RepID=UPI0011AB4E35|nr:hypothetical protein [Acidihalobacter prosperus]